MTETREITFNLLNGELLCRYELNLENELVVNPVFDRFFNNPGSEDAIHISNIKLVLNGLGDDILTFNKDGKVESAQVINIENPSIFNRLKITPKELMNLISFFSENKEEIFNGELIPIENFKEYKSVSKFLVVNDNYIYVPTLTFNYLNLKLSEIENAEED